jgi:membrane protease YdiL (CAAX protease family)
MSDASSPNKTIGAGSGSWGVIAATLWGVVTFLVPQALVGVILPLIEALPLTANMQASVEKLIMIPMMLGVVYWVVRKVYKLGWQSLGYRKILPKHLLWVALAYPAYIAIMVTIVDLAGFLTKTNLQQPQVTGFIAPHGLELIPAFIVLVIVVPVVEETIFRGFLFGAYRRKFGFLIGTLLVSLVFAAVHTPLNVQLDVFALSLVLCYLREKTDSLWPSIMLHILKNLVAFVLSFIIIVK